MQKKKLLLLICVLFSILYVDAKTDFKKINDLYYNLDDASMKAFVAPPNKSQYDFTKQNGVIKIPATVVHKKKIYNVVSIGNESFKDCKTLKSIDIPNSVTYIGQEAFSGCSGLTSVSIDNSVTAIGEGAFMSCKSLLDIVIPHSVTSIEKYVFKDCGLTNVTIGDSVTSIGEGAFMSCNGLTSVVIPNSVITIERFAFNDCGLTSVTIGDSVTSIGEGAFMSCNGLTSVVIPNSVITIDQLAFWHCNGLKTVVIGRSVSKIGQAAFNECGNLREVEFNAENCTFCGTSKNIKAFQFEPGQGSYKIIGFRGIDIKEVQNYLDGKVSGYVFPSNLTYLKIGTNVKTIPDKAFSDCTGLKEVEFDAENCQSGRFPSKLTSLKIGNKVKHIPNDAFYGCSSLTSVEIPNSVTSIGNYAFYGCSGLTSVTIGNSVTSIGDYAFNYCSNIKNITIPISVTTFGKDVFIGCGSAVDKAYQEWITRAGTQGNEFAKNILDKRKQAEAREAENQRKIKERLKQLRSKAQYVIKPKNEYYDTYIYLNPDGRAYMEAIGNEKAEYSIIRTSGTWKILSRYIGNSYRRYFSISTQAGNGWPYNFYMFVNGDKIWMSYDSFNQLDYRTSTPATIEKLK